MSQCLKFCTWFSQDVSYIYKENWLNYFITDVSKIFEQKLSFCIYRLVVEIFFFSDTNKTVEKGLCMKANGKVKVKKKNGKVTLIMYTL